MKYLIFDSGSIITLAMNSLLDVLRNLKKGFQGKFLITEQVKYECIDHPSKIKKYELGALQIKELLEEGILELPDKNLRAQIQKKTQEFLNKANHTYSSQGQWIQILDEGEASCLALSSLLQGNKMIVVDERTTRMLVENPENLHKLYEEKFHTKIKAEENNYSFFENNKLMRSCELVFIAYKKGLIKLPANNLLDALLYATKFKGASISKEEIEAMERM
jgi:predicted nucleic acid-binding protein